MEQPHVPAPIIKISDLFVVVMRIKSDTRGKVQFELYLALASEEEEGALVLCRL